jgi:hypothetical protein
MEGNIASLCKICKRDRRDRQQALRLFNATLQLTLGWKACQPEPSDIILELALVHPIQLPAFSNAPASGELPDVKRGCPKTTAKNSKETGHGEKRGQKRGFAGTLSG